MEPASVGDAAEDTSAAADAAAGADTDDVGMGDQATEAPSPSGTDGEEDTPGSPARAEPAEPAAIASDEASVARRAGSPPPRLVTAPRFARRTLSMVETGPRWPGVAVILALGLLLALQLLLSQRAQLAEKPLWRPTLERVCGVLRCSLPAWREPEAFAMVTRSVRPSPVHPGVLEITATFRNDAAREQAWPVLLLSLSDIHGQTVGARAFHPPEYRDQRTTGDTLAPGQTVTVLLDVVEPAPDTVAFSFDFR